MAVLTGNNYGWMVDHLFATRLYLEAAQQENEGNNKVIDQQQKVQMKSDLFEIVTPFRMDSQAHKMSTSDKPCVERKRKRKRKAPLSIGEQQALDYHEEVKDHIFKAYISLLDQSRALGHFQPTTVKGDNNLEARKAAHDEPLCDLDLLKHTPKEEVEEYTLKCGDTIPAEKCMNTLWHYHGNKATSVTLTSGRHIIPPHCTFLMSDLEVLLYSYTALGHFDLIVLDPPWENKSVKRKKKYSYLTNDQLLTLPLGSLAAPGCLVIVWVTNSYRHRQFVSEELFPKHGIQSLAKWHWLKVTCLGEMVCDFDSAHKKPYETLIIGEVPDPGRADVTSRARPSGDKTIISVPCSLHSKKPPLYDILKSYLPCKPRCLELFARNLQPHWTSWGNEVLLHQHQNFYENVP